MDNRMTGKGIWDNGMMYNGMVDGVGNWMTDVIGQGLMKEVGIEPPWSTRVFCKNGVIRAGGYAETLTSVTI